MSVLVLAGALGTTNTLWERQIDAFSSELDVRTLEYEGSSVAEIAEHALAELPERFSLCGVSLGGMVGMWIAANEPARIERLVLACTGAKLGSSDDYRARAERVRREGTGFTVDGARERWFTPDFRDTPTARRILDELRTFAAEAYADGAEAVAGFDFRGELHRVEVPTLVVFGRDDPVTTPEVRAELARFDCVEIPGAHLANVESPDEFNDLLRSFL